MLHRMDADVPPAPARSTARVGGLEILLDRRGTGPGVLVVHDAGAEVVGAPAWTGLARDHEVVQLLLPGYGGSQPPPPTWTPADAGGAVAALTRHLWPDPPVLVGTSLGAWFALEAELAAPGTAAALVLCSPAGLQVPQGFLFDLYLDGRAALGTASLLGAVFDRQLPPQERDVADLPPAVRDAVVAPWSQEVAATAWCCWNPFVVDPGMLVRARALRCPTTVLCGADDALIPVAHGRALAAAIPGAALGVVAGAGHLLPLERPGVVAAAVRGVERRGAPQRGAG